MVAKAEVVVHQSSIPLLGVQFRRSSTNLEDVEGIVSIPLPLSPSPPTCDPILAADSLSTDLSRCLAETEFPGTIFDATLNSAVLQFSPTIRSGSFADIGPRRYMEDEHIRIDDLSTHFGSPFRCPKPSAFYGVFDGHGGPEAAAYVRKNVTRFFFEDTKFPQTHEVTDAFLEEVKSSLRKAFLLADLALADDPTVSSSSGTTALTALILGSLWSRVWLLMVANAGDCRAVVSRKGEAVDMSQDHRPSYASERRRVEALGGYIDDGYLNGVLSVTRALGDWDMKLPRGSSSPLIADPEFKQMVLTEDDEFLIIGCDGIWDVMSSQHAVSVVRRGLRRHDDPEQCAKDLVTEALRFNTSDNLTVIVVCLSSIEHREVSPPLQRRLRCCTLTEEALCSLRSLLDSNDTR